MFFEGAKLRALCACIYRQLPFHTSDYFCIHWISSACIPPSHTFFMLLLRLHSYKTHYQSQSSSFDAAVAGAVFDDDVAAAGAAFEELAVEELAALDELFA